MEVYTPDFEPLLSRDDDRIPEGLFTKETHMCRFPKALCATRGDPESTLSSLDWSGYEVQRRYVILIFPDFVSPGALVSWIHRECHIVAKVFTKSMPFLMKSKPSDQ